jgi:hypothetical protein
MVHPLLPLQPLSRWLIRFVWASPGRFFAGNEMKAAVAYLVINYDVKFPDDGPRPANEHFGLAVVPDSNAKVLFRKRQATV